MNITEHKSLSDKGPIVVACAADRGYVMPLAAMVKSFLVNMKTEREIHLYVVDGGLGADNRTRLVKSWQCDGLTVHFIEMSDTLPSDLPLWGRMNSNIIYQKLLMPSLLPLSVSKAVFLDCDLIVNGDLDEIWNIDIGDRSVLAVQDMVVPYVSSLYGITSYRELGIKPEEKYFNTGFMAVNLQWWRTNGTISKAFDFLRTYRETIFFHEQEALNAVLSGTWGELHPAWNQIECVSGRPFFRCSHLDDDTYREVIERPRICHYAGTFKPWLLNTRRPHQELYFKYLDLTDWAGWRPKRAMKGILMSLYEARLRNFLYPAEKWYMKYNQRSIKHA